MILRAIGTTALGRMIWRQASSGEKILAGNRQVKHQNPTPTKRLYYWCPRVKGHGCFTATISAKSGRRRVRIFWDRLSIIWSWTLAMVVPCWSRPQPGTLGQPCFDQAISDAAGPRYPGHPRLPNPAMARGVLSNIPSGWYRAIRMNRMPGMRGHHHRVYFVPTTVVIPGRPFPALTMIRHSANGWEVNRMARRMDQNCIR